MGAWDKFKSGVSDITPGATAPWDTAKSLYSGGLSGGAASAASDAYGGIKGVPVVGGIASAPSDIFNHFFTGPANEEKAALDQASVLNNQSNDTMMKYYADQQAAARAYYQPLQDMFTTSYGTGGIQAPQAPTAPGKPLTSMYGGKQ